MGLMKSLLPLLSSPTYRRWSYNGCASFRGDSRKRMDDALCLLQTFLSTIPKCDNTDYEGHYQSLLYTIFSLLGMYVDVEVRTPVVVWIW